MASLNKVQIIGRLGQDPEVKAVGDTSVCNLSIATSEKWRDKSSGETKEKTEWHRVIIWGKLADVAGKYLKKGSEVYIEGKLETRKWTDNAGVEKYSTEIVVNIGGTMQMLGSAPGGNSGQQQQQQRPQPSSQQQAGNPNDNDDAPF